MTTQFFEVGGCVRDSLLGLESNDVDFTVVGPASFDDFHAELTGMGFQIFESRPEFFTIRAKVPDSMPELRARTRVADFVLARRDGPSSDGRRPDFTVPGNLFDDLDRRDFTVNAMARGLDGVLHDPFNGQEDLANRTLRFVGVAAVRIEEDGLRVLRGLRFMVTKSLTPTPETFRDLQSVFAAEMLGCVSKERRREELNKMLAFDTMTSFELLASLPTITVEAILAGGLRLKATMEEGSF